MGATAPPLGPPNRRLWCAPKVQVRGVQWRGGLLGGAVGGLGPWAGTGKCKKCWHPRVESARLPEAFEA
eukprot:12183771-Alexandrium_andersonii.AAC.1